MTLDQVRAAINAAAREDSDRALLALYIARAAQATQKGFQDFERSLKRQRGA